MAKLYLKFESSVLKELPIGQGTVVTIGRLPDNTLQIDNLAVSGHHAKIYWDTDHYVVEDNHSLNGTYVNNQRAGKQTLKDNDSVLVGKHTIVFKDEWHDDSAADKPKAAVVPALPKMDATVVLDTKKAKEMLAQARAASMPQPAPAEPARITASDETPPAGTPSQPASTPRPVVAAQAPAPAAGAKNRMGTLTVLEGKSDEGHYVLSSKLTVVGGSKMASIKLKGGFFSKPPEVAAMISKQDDRYTVAPQDKKVAVKINGADVTQKQELHEGDVVQIWKVKMAFGYHE